MNFLIVNPTKKYNINVGLIISKYISSYLFISSNYYINLKKYQFNIECILNAEYIILY